MHTVKIVTTDPKTLNWKSLNSKISAIEAVLNTATNADFRVSIIHVNTVPDVQNGRITHNWFDDFRGWTSDFVVLHMNEKQKTEWGIKPSLRGSRHNDSDDVGEMYVWADENTKRGRFNQFIQTILHEIRHELCAGTGSPDDTHELHGSSGDISPYFASFDMATYRPARQRQKQTFRDILIRWIRWQQPQTLHSRLPDPYNDYISQEYGVENPSYSMTGHHIGVDYACPTKTPVYAPWGGEITVSGNATDLGNFCYYRYVYNGKVRVERYLHLSTVPKRGAYKRGNTVAYTGDTGFSTAPHLHVDGWWKEVNTGIINSENWSDLTYNPHIT